MLVIFRGNIWEFPEKTEREILALDLWIYNLSKFQDHQATLKQHQEEKCGYKAQSDDCDIPLTKHRSKLTELIHDYNQVN